MIVPSLRRRALRINGERYELKPSPELVAVRESGRLEVRRPSAVLHPGDAVPHDRTDTARPLGRWLIVRKHDDRAVGALIAARAGHRLRLTLEGSAARDCAALRELPGLIERWARAIGASGSYTVRIGRSRPRVIAGGDIRRIGTLGMPTRSRSGGMIVRSLDATLARLGVPADYGDTRGLPRIREPRVLEVAGVDLFGRIQWLAPRAAQAWRLLRAAAHASGVALQLVSAFRSAEYQAGLIERKLARGATIDDILEVNAAPGFSQHHSGRAIDVAHSREDALEERFERTDAFRWLAANAGTYGFTLSYPRGNPHGIAYEPWHWFYSDAGSAGT